MSPLEPRQPLAVVTGGSRGLGAILAEYLVSSGYEIVLTARHAGALEATARRLRARGGPVTCVVGAVEDPAHRQAILSTVSHRGALDLLVNNASELGVTPLPPLASYPLDAFRQVLEVNLLAPLALLQELLPHLKAARGLVVNITSDAAVGAYPGWGAYGSSKAGLELLSRTLADELRGSGVSVTVVDPGDMRTEMHQAAFAGVDISDRPLPEVTVPFWAWLLGQPPEAVSGQRLQAQGERWETRP